MEEAVSERPKAFAHRSKIDHQAYISASRHASSAIAIAKTEEWKATCSSLSHISDLKSLYALLCSIAGSSSSSSSPTVPLPVPLCQLPEIPLFCFPAKSRA